MDNSVAALIKFHDLCKVFEATHELKKRDKTSALVDFMKQYKEKATELKNTNPNANVSFYPALRLILPLYERERKAYGLKEVTLGKRFIKILCLPQTGADAMRLTNFRTSTNSNVKDFADSAYWVLRKYFLTGSKLSIVDVNEYLDAIAEGHANNDPRAVDAQLHKLFRETSAEEQRWLIRIILKDLRLGLGLDRILNLYHPDAADLFATNNSLSKICDTLTDPSIRLHEIEVSVFSPFRPMLSQRCDVSQCKKLFSGNVKLYIETKFDGERFQLHMENNRFKYFSRNAFDYTSTYGETFTTGFYTPLLKNAFKPHVRKVILDGEMMGWNTIKKKFGSKGMDFDVKHLKPNNIHQPCFCVFDILLLNDDVVTNKPLKDRVLLLDTILKPIHGVIVISHRIEAATKQDVIKALNASMDREEEGIVFKNIESPYKSNNRNAGWWKMKLEYFENVMSDLDVIIIGGYYGEGRNVRRITGFLVGVAVPPVDGRSVTPTGYLSLAKIASGLNDEELRVVEEKLGPHWKKLTEGDPEEFGVQWGKDKPDMWIPPNKSIIVQVRASELIRVHSFDFKTDYTLRFPRIQKIRLDKPYYDCLTITEFQELTSSSKAVEKLSKRHLELEDLDPPQKEKKSRRGIVSVEMQPVEQKSELLSGYQFCVLTGCDNWTRDEIETVIRENCGTVVKNEGTETLCILVGDDHPRVNTCIKSDVPYDLVKLQWLRQVLEADEFKLYTPQDTLHVGKETRNRFLREYDKYGDSYMEDATLESVQNILKRVEDDKESIFLTPEEINKLEKELNTSQPLNVFKNSVGYFDKLEKDYERNSVYPVSPAIVEEIEFRFLGGAVSDTLDENVTLVIMDKRNDSRKREILEYLAGTNNNPVEIVTKDFITEKFAEVQALFSVN